MNDFAEAPFVACTIIARNYFAHARVLMQSFKQYHPDIPFVVLVVDGRSLDADERRTFAHGSRAEFPAAYIIYPDELALSEGRLQSMAAIYDVTEFSTALKPSLLLHLLDQGAKAALYFDPDIDVFSDLSALADATRTHGLVLTPHLLNPLADDGKGISQTSIALSGAFNLGFCGASSLALALLTAWREWLAFNCIIDHTNGLFTDQRWMDFAPSFFPTHVERSPRYNVAYWNAHERPIEDGYRVAGEALGFFHFSGFDPLRPHWLSKHQGAKPRILLSEHPLLARLCESYAAKLAVSAHAHYRTLEYALSALPNGKRLSLDERRCYRAALIRGDAPTKRPFSREGAAELQRWLAPSPAPIHVSQWPSFSHERLPFGVNLVGYFSAELGIGQAGRSVLRGVEHLGVPYSAFDLTAWTLNRKTEFFNRELASDLPFATNILCLNADGLCMLRDAVGDEFLSRRRNIGLWFWEVDVLTSEHLKAARLLDEVWTASEFTAEQLRRAIDTPVHVMPLTVPAQRTDASLSRAQLGLADDFLFYFAFDMFSVMARKNPLGVIEAFRRAFPDSEPASLLIKVINAEHEPANAEKLRLAAKTDARVTLWEKYLDRRDNDALFASIDGYVSLHRAEGFGLTLAEAMAAGKPVIGTAFSGTLEFMHESRSYLVPYTETDVGPDAAPYPAQARWAEPDLDIAAQHMRAIYEHREEARERAQRGQQFVRDRYSPKAVAAFIEQRLRLRGDIISEAKEKHHEATA